MPFSVVGSEVNVSVFQRIQNTMYTVYFLRYNSKQPMILGLAM